MKGSTGLVLLMIALFALGGLLALKQFRGRGARLRYVEPGMPETDEEVDAEALLTDVGASISPERPAAP